MIDQRLKFLGPPILVAILIVLPASVAHAQMASSSWPQVPPVDWSKLKPEDFSDDELDLPYYLGNFHKLANSVVETGENRGFMDLSVWRSPQDNKPYNARIMENILSLAFFVGVLGRFPLPFRVFTAHERTSTCSDGLAASGGAKPPDGHLAGTALGRP